MFCGQKAEMGPEHVKWGGHLSFVVKDLDESIKTWDKILGLEGVISWYIEDYTEVDEPGGIRAVIIPIGPNFGIELMEAKTGSGPVKAWYDKMGESIHHFGFWVEDADEEAKRLKKEGLRLDPYSDKTGQARNDQTGCPYVFIHPEAVGTVVEFCQDFMMDTDHFKTYVQDNYSSPPEKGRWTEVWYSNRHQFCRIEKGKIVPVGPKSPDEPCPLAKVAMEQGRVVPETLKEK